MTEPPLASAPAPAPAPAPAAHPGPEPESDVQYVLSIISLLLGFLFLVGGLALYATRGEAANLKLVLAVGVFLFVLGAMLRLGALVDAFRQRSSYQGANAVVMSALAFGVVVFTNHLARTHDFWRADLTQEGLYTLSEESRGLVEHLERDVRLVVLLRGNDAETKDVLDTLLDQYQAASSHVRIERIDANQKSQRELLALLRELELGTNVDEDQAFGVVVQTGVQTAEGWKKEKSKHIPRADLWEEDFAQGRKRTFVGEQKVSSAIRELLEGQRPKLYFLDGHGERRPEDHDEKLGLATLSGQLRQRNFEVAALKLAQGEDVPEDCALLVVAGPQRPLAPVEVASVRRYLDRGGDAIILLEPAIDRRDQGATRFATSGLEDLLRDPYGVVAEDRYILLLMRDPLRRGGVAVVDEVPCDEYDLAHKVVAPLNKVGGAIDFQGARPLKTLGSGAGAPTALVRTGQVTPAARSTTDPLNMVNSIPGEQPGPFTLVTASEREVAAGPAPTDGGAQRKVRSRVVVAGDVDWISNAYLTHPMYLNLELFQNAAMWCLEREDAVVGKAARPRSYRLTLDEGTLSFLCIVAIIGLPTVALCAGVFVWLVRRR